MSHDVVAVIERPTGGRGPSGESPPQGSSRPTLVTLAALASIGAGALHATAVGIHSDHAQATTAFALLAAFQLGWGGLALARWWPWRWIGLLGIAGHAMAVGGWVLAKANGIAYIDGLDEPEAVQFVDALAAGLAALTVLSVAVQLGTMGRARWMLASQPLVVVAGVLVVGLVVPAMATAESHVHGGGGGDGGEVAVGNEDGGHDHGEADGVEAGDGELATADDADHGDHGASAQPAEPYAATLPVNLSGVDGVTAEQQVRAENLVEDTLLDLPQFADVAEAEALGWRSIGDAGTGFEHYINWGLINDDRVLDPDFPESLVYRVDGEERVLEAAMYLLNQGDTLETVPDVGGPLTQWHVHNDLCFTTESDDDGVPAFKVGDLAPPGDTCRPGTQRLQEPGQETPMLHVWIVPHECGPFAALEGVGAGQIAQGEERLCDHDHGVADVGDAAESASAG